MKVQTGAGRPAAGTRPEKRSKAPGCVAGCLLLLVALGAVGLFVGRSLIEGAVGAAIRQEMPADHWQVTVSLLTAPQVLLGQPIDIDLAGAGVQTKEGVAIQDLKLQIEGLKLSVVEKKAVGCDRVGIDATFSPDQLTSILAQQALGLKMLQDVSVRVEGGKLVILGTFDLAQLLGGLKLPPFVKLGGPAQVEITTTPRVVPPSVVVFDIVSVEGKDSPINFDANQRAALSRTLRIDLAQLAPWLQITSCSVAESGIRLVGEITGEAIKEFF